MQLIHMVFKLVKNRVQNEQIQDLLTLSGYAKVLQHPISGHLEDIAFLISH